MLLKILSVSGLVSAGLLLIFVTTTTPLKAGAFGILCVFILGYTVSLTAVTFLLWSTGAVMNKIYKAMRLRRQPYALSMKRAYYFSTIIALAPVITISLQSVGGVGIYELLLITLFTVMGCIYVYRRTI